MGTGGDHMDSQGTVVVRLSTSSALIPLQGATVTITKTRPDGTQELLAVRVTNFDGLTAPHGRDPADGREPELSEHIHPLCCGRHPRRTHRL